MTPGPPHPGIEIGPLDGAAMRAAIPELAELLVDAVDSGASVNFLAGLTVEAAADWWAARLPDVDAGRITPIVARESIGERRLVGVVVLIRAMTQNAPHRAEIVKMLVHSTARRRGIAAGLLSTAESIARDDGRWLLFLDTETGSDAEHFYVAQGWQAAGTIPDYALTFDGRLAPTTFYWKRLR